MALRKVWDGARVGLLVLGVALAGCAGAVTGTVEQDGRAVPGATVTVGGRQVQTGPDGSFILAGVPEGQRSVVATLAVAGGAFAARTVDVAVDGSGSTSAGIMTLPEPVEISLVEAMPTAVSLQWTPSTDPGFREYRVVRGRDAALTLENGDLVAVHTDVDDVAFTDDGADWDIGLRPGDSYWYRVYVLDEFGLLGGSNILQADTPLWEATQFDVAYELTEVGQFALAHAAVGLAWDGGVLWIASMRENGGYYDPNDVWLSRRDLDTGAVLQEHHYDDEYLKASGLAWDGGSLWLNYTSTGQGSRYAKQIDPATGAPSGQYGLEDGIVDVGFDGEHLLLHNKWNHLDFLDPGTGAVTSGFEVPFRWSSGRGVAHRPGEYWLSSRRHDQLIVMNVDGDHIGVVDLPMASAGQMTFAGDQLALVHEGRVYIFEVTPLQS